ncbi:ABC transporter substrate-binding protein [Chloroflexota bacterium]
MTKRFLIFGLLIATVLASVGIVGAQGPGEGGVIFVSDASDPATFNPLLGGDVTSSNVYLAIYPGLFGLDPETGLLSPGYAGSLATSWEYNDDGTVLTIHLREDATWNDGEPITAHDWVWGVEALRSGLLDTPRSTQMWEVLDDGTPGSGSVVDAIALDDYTIEVTFNRADCQSIGDVWDTVLPSHIFEEDFGDDLAAMNDEPRYLPGVSFDVWKDPELVAGDRVSLVADQHFPDAALGYVSPSERVILNLPDSDVALERFRAGELTYTGIPGNKQAEFENDPNFQTYRYNRAGYVFYAFNHANPENPQAGYDEDGNYIEQEPHPILGDKSVRQAITMAVDMDAIIENTLGGNAVRVGIPSIPPSWDWNPDLLYPLDPVAAGEMLDEAGWILEDGAEFRTCQGCAHAEEGTEMALRLNSDSGGGEDSTKMIESIAQNMRDIGINAEANFIDWSSAFLPELDGQTFDMAILAWSLGLPLDPDNTDIFTIENDVPGAGFNFGSFHSEELDQIYIDARDPALTEGCTVEGRLPFYARANEIIFDELPYMFMYSNLRLAAAQPWVEGWNPVTFDRAWNEDTWVVMEPAE